jgi:CheY-like chemotaxis protein
MSRTKCPVAILVVDDTDLVRRAMVRLLGRYFATVLSAGTATGAEALLERERPPFLLCDYWLGQGVPPATSFIPRWRTSFPFLRRVALMTGTKASALHGAEGVDAVFQKPLELSEVIAFFTGAES